MHSAIPKNILLVLLILMLIFLFLINIGIGAVNIPLKDILRAFLTDTDDTVSRIILQIRLPRTIVAMLVGMSLALAGAILQGVMRNPLATPNIIGVSSGAGLTALTILILFPKHYPLVPIGAFVGAFTTTLLIYLLARKNGTLPTRLILAGVAVNAILGAGNDILLSAYPERVSGVISFMVGGLSGCNWKEVRMISPYILIAILIALLLSRKMNILILGDEVAIGLGLSVERTRLAFIALASLLAGSAVSAVGLLGFVGLIVPHVARIFVGNDARIHYPVSLLMGAILLLSCDLLARTLLAPKEIPVGILMSVLGGPFFLYLLRKNYREN